MVWRKSRYSSDPTLFQVSQTSLPRFYSECAFRGNTALEWLWINCSRTQTEHWEPGHLSFFYRPGCTKLAEWFLSPACGRSGQLSLESYATSSRLHWIYPPLYNPVQKNDRSRLANKLFDLRRASLPRIWYIMKTEFKWERLRMPRQVYVTESMIWKKYWQIGRWICYFMIIGCQHFAPHK